MISAGSRMRGGPALALLVLAGMLASLPRAAAMPGVTRWVVLDGTAAGLQLLADARQPFAVPPLLNGRSGASGMIIVLPDGSGPALFRDSGGTVTPVALYTQL